MRNIIIGIIYLIIPQFALSQSVGIGTNSPDPSYQLHIANQNGNIVLLDGTPLGTSSLVAFKHSNSTQGTVGFANNDFEIAKHNYSGLIKLYFGPTDPGTGFYMAAGIKAMLGTQTGTAKMTIAGDNSFTSHLELRQQGIGSATTRYKNEAYAESWATSGYLTGSALTDYFTFTHNTAPSQVLTMWGNNRVGINWSSAPTAAFEVHGIGSDHLARFVSSFGDVYITSVGEIGVNTTATQGKIHIKHNSTFNGTSHIVLEESENDYSRITFKNTATSSAWVLASLPAATNASAAMNFFYQGLNGDVLSLKGNGNATLAGTLTQFSDKRLKTNIHSIKSALQSIQKLNAYSYQWRDVNKDQSLQIGFIAQEVESVFPEMVKTDENGTKSVAYLQMIPVLLQAIKEQQKQIEIMQAKIEAMEKRSQK